MYPGFRILRSALIPIQFDPPMDSSDMDPDAWRKLVRIISDNYNQYTGFVILHGTDTMAYNGIRSQLYARGPQQAPSSSSGSQLPIGVLRTDGKENLLTSIEIATAGIPTAIGLSYPEVCIFLRNHLTRQPYHQNEIENFNAFRSYNYPYLLLPAYILNIIMCRFIRRTYKRVAATLPARYQYSHIEALPGIQENVVDAILAIKGLKAVVLETYGSGNAR